MSSALPRKEQRIDLRATPRQVEVIDQAAAALEKNRSEFMLDVTLRESQRVLTDRRVFLLDDRARDEFLRLLDRPPVEKPRLRALFERGSVLGKE